MTRIEMTAIALTPIHVGDGAEWTPESYDIRDNALCRFEPARVIARMRRDARLRYLGALDRGDLGAAQTELRGAAHDEMITERIPLSEASRSDLGTALRDPAARSGKVSLFIRSGGRPYIPGSTLKGAFRTALASHFIAGDGARPRPGAPREGEEEEVMRRALGLVPGDTSADPLRFLHVADAELPEGATRVDKSEIVHHDPGRSSAGGIQMHVERLRSRADGPANVPRLSFALTLDEAAMTRARTGDARRRSYDRATLFRAVNRFHWDVWRRELDRFAAVLTQKSRDLMEAYLRQRRHPEGGMLADRGPEGTANFLLLRIGRFGHFESKSLAGWRQGYVPQRKGEKWRQPDEFGATRTVIRMGGAPIPFGWLLAWVKAPQA